MYKLMVSHDAGCSYHQYGESDDIGKLTTKGKEYDEQMLRWFIEDEKGDIVEASAIHKGIIAFMEKVIEREAQQK